MVKSYFSFDSRNLGGKLGHAVMEQLAVENMGELCQFELTMLQLKFGDKTGWVDMLAYPLS